MFTNRVTYRRAVEGVHVKLTIWSQGANIGTLTVRTDELEVLDAVEVALTENGAKADPSFGRLRLDPSKLVAVVPDGEGGALHVSSDGAVPLLLDEGGDDGR